MIANFKVVFLVGLFAIGFLGTFTFQAKALPTLVGTPIATDAAEQGNPDVSGNIIVWADSRNGNADIYAYDLSTNMERQITTDTARQHWPAVSGNIIVWEDDRNGNADIYAYDLSTNMERQITTDPTDQLFPDISGNLIVWEDARHSTVEYFEHNLDIYAYDLSTNMERQITTDTTDQQHPAVSGDTIVWDDIRNGNFDIYAYDLSTSMENQITTDSGDQSYPDVSDYAIVWHDGRNVNLNYNNDIYAYDLSTNMERQITTDTANQLYPAISGYTIVWTDWRNGDWYMGINADIYAYDLSTNMERQITTDTANQLYPAISGYTIVWQDDRNGNEDIFAGIGRSLTVTSPNGGQIWVRGTTHAITWSSSGITGTHVKIELLKGGFVNKVISFSTANDGSYSWKIPSLQTLGINYKIRVTSTTNVAIKDSSNSNFAIVAGVLTVTSPNGWQTWTKGTVHTITWSSVGHPGAYVKIELLKRGVVCSVISSITANDGLYRWTIPSMFASGINYRIRITSKFVPSITDSSNSNFAIT